MRHAKSEADAKRGAETIRRRLGISEDVPTGIVLGTGWGKSLTLYKERSLHFSQIPGFESLEPLEGHKREVEFGFAQDPNGGFHPVIMLRGRVHLNERTSDPELDAMVRLQIDMLLELGVKTLILTCAAGSLLPHIEVGNIVMIDGFITAYAPPIPLKGGEFCSPEDTIDQALLAEVIAKADTPLKLHQGGHAMTRGSYFEGRKYDKRILASFGASVVGMSVLPEACFAAAHGGVRTLPLAFITNDAVEEHSHEENQLRANAQSEHLSNLLEQIVSLASR